MEHAKYPPSASERWLICPGSITLAEKLGPEGPPSPYAWEGTICHDLSAECLRKNKQANEYVGAVVEGVSITQELSDAMQMYIDEVRSTAVDMKVNGGKIEYPIKITEDCWGTVDSVLWNKELLTIMDAKFGKGVVVEAEDNTQMRLYAIGALKALKAEGIVLPKQVCLKIIQPRTVNPIREQLVTIEELQAWAKEVLGPALERLRKEDTTCVPGEVQCRWCRVSPHCTAQANSMINKAAEAFAPFTEAEQPEIATGGNADPLLGLEAKAKLALSFSHIENWMKGIRDYLMELALTGESIPFFKLVEGRSVRKWGVEEDKLVVVLDCYGIDPYEKKLKTPPAVEKEMGKKKAKEVSLEDLIVKPAGSPTLVPESDKRPAMPIKVEKDFTPFVEGSGWGPTAEVKEIATSGSPILIVGDDVSDGELSLMQRLKRGMVEPEKEPKSERKVITILEPKKEAKVDESMLFSGSEEIAKLVTNGTFPDEPGLFRTPDPVKPAIKSVLDESTIFSDADASVSESKPKGKNPTPPTAPKRKEVLTLFLDNPGITLADAADALSSTENSIRMHLRYLHERDGYGYTIYGDGQVTVEG